MKGFDVIFINSSFQRFSQSGSYLIFSMIAAIGFLNITIINGCKEETGKPQGKSNGKPTVVCTTTMIGDIADQIGGDRIQVIKIMKPGVDPHSYDPTPKDIIWFKKADLILYNGVHLEGNLLNMIKSSGTRAVAVAEDERIKLRAKAGNKGAADPHCWWNVAYFKMYVENARDALIKTDTEGAEVYQQLATAYLKKLDELDAHVRKEVKRIPETQRVLVTSHDAFFYFGEAYGFMVDAVLGISTDAEVQALRTKELATLITGTETPAVFHETSVSDALNRMIDKVVEIAAASGHKVKVADQPLYSDSLGSPGTPSGTYIGAMTENTRIIVNALSGTETAGEQQNEK